MSTLAETISGTGFVVRPFDGAPPSEGGRSDQFSSTFAQTLQLLRQELRHLEADRVVIEMAITESDIRVTGELKLSARPSSPAVRISFDSKWGPLRYETGEYWDWKANVRAIALSMEALRAVDRYGVSRRGEQYKGWAQLPKSTDPADSITTQQQAIDVLRAYATSEQRARGADKIDLVRQAIKATHPDTGGDPTEFRKVMRAKELIGA